MLIFGPSAFAEMSDIWAACRLNLFRRVKRRLSGVLAFRDWL